jgi:pyruvate formate lyase activating enzyme
MKIVGLQKLTLLDFPGQVACTVFLGGCNFRCPFCHNSQLLDGKVEEVMSADNLMTFLNGRKGILDGVCVTGGEPTLQPQLPQLLRCIKEMGSGSSWIPTATARRCFVLWCRRGWLTMWLWM